MSENQALDFVCVSCWEGFQVESQEINDAQESVLCPHCGADVPIPNANDKVAADELVDENIESEDESVMEAGKKKRAAPQAILVEEDPDAEAEAVAEEEVEVEPVEPSTDPEEILWRVQVPGGLAYNFHGISTLKRWCGTKSKLSGIAVAYQHQSWRNLEELMDHLMDGMAVLTAFEASTPMLDPGLPSPSDSDSGSGFSSAHNAFASIPSLEEIEAGLSGASYSAPVDEPEAEEIAPPLSVDEVEISNEESFGDLSYSKATDDDSYDLDTTESSDEEWEYSKEQDDVEEEDADKVSVSVSGSHAPIRTTATIPIPDLGPTDPSTASGQFTFQVSTGRSDVGARVLMLMVGMLFGLGLGALCQVLGYWDKLIP
jgi:hypothetical protein